jgi:hypothetical protein
MTIAALLAALGSQASRYAVFASVGLTLIGGAYLKGRADYKEVCRNAAAAETVRQVAINRAAFEAANETTNALNAQIETLSAELQKVQDEADKDPRAADCGVGADSVRRLNRIQ